MFNIKELEEIDQRSKEVGREILTDFTMVTCLARPKSVGSIRLKSSNYTEYPRIDPQYLSDERDVMTMVKGRIFLGFRAYIKSKEKVYFCFLFHYV